MPRDVISILTGYMAAGIGVVVFLLYARRLHFISRSQLLLATVALMAILEFAISVVVVRKATLQKPDDDV